MDKGGERNIEIKARISSPDEFENKIKIAESLTKTTGEIIKQHDVFFNSKSGRLKLRYLETKSSELIHYNRPDVAGPKLSTYNKIDVNEPQVLEKILTESVGVRGIVKKTRKLFLYNETRIHLDHVDSLGYFLEFEVCLKPESTLEQGEKVAEELMKVFGIQKEDLMTSAYLDELIK